MGLDLHLEMPTGDTARWSYGAFMRFRERLARAAGYGNLRAYEGYDGKKPWPEGEQVDPLVHLLNHSDCDGEIEGWRTPGLGERLRTIVEQWPDDPLDFDRRMGLALAEMFEKAEQGGGRVVFS